MSARPRARLDLFMHPLPDGVVFFDPRSEATHLLNATASFIFACCDGEHDEDSIVLELRQALGEALPAEQAQRDVRSTLLDLRTRELLEPDAPVA